MNKTIILFRPIGFPNLKYFEIIWMLVLWIWLYLVKVITEARCVLYIRYLRVITNIGGRTQNMI